MASSDPETSFIDRLQAIAYEVYGERGSDENQEPTGAVGHMPRIQVLFMARQGGPTLTERTGYWDARDHLSTRRKKGEWTGYHAEMMIVSAMVTMLSRDARELTVTQARELLGQAGAPTIVANAPCCKHCSNMLELLGITHPSGPKKASLTGWWNPFTDEVFPNGSLEFRKDVPGHS